MENPFGMMSRPDKSATYHSWGRFAPHSWCVADFHIPFASLLSRYAPQVVIWRGFAGQLIIPKGFSNTPALYRQDYYNFLYKGPSINYVVTEMGKKSHFKHSFWVFSSKWEKTVCYEKIHNYLIHVKSFSVFKKK